MFSTQSDNCIPIVHIFDLISLFAAEFEEPKIGISGKGLIKDGIVWLNIVIMNKILDPSSSARIFMMECPWAKC